MEGTDDESSDEVSSSDEQYAPSWPPSTEESSSPTNEDDDQVKVRRRRAAQLRLAEERKRMQIRHESESSDSTSTEEAPIVSRKRVRSAKRKKYPPKCASGAPASIESISGNKNFTVVDYTKPNNKKTPAEKRNEIIISGIENLEHGFTWTDHIPNIKGKPPFTGPTPGPTSSDNNLPINAFANVTSGWIHEWMKYTNENGYKTLAESWQPVTEEQAAAYFSTMLHMSVQVLPQMWMYWDDPEYSSPLLKQTISRKRFYEISKYSKLHSETEVLKTGESNPTSSNYDPYYRVNGVWKSFYTTAQQQKNATEDVDIDETVIAFKGRWKGITLNPNKPGNKKKGLRLYNLVDADGYSLNGIFYSNQKLKYDAKGRFFAILFALMDNELLPGGNSFLNLGHKLFCDNLYTEITTIVALKAKNTYYCGTLRVGRSFLPKPILINRQSQYQGIKFERGDSMFAYSASHGLLVCNWLDKRHVFVASSLPHIKNQIGSCTRNQRNRNGKYFKITLARPKVIEDYSMKMNYVDRSDQLVDAQRRQTKATKWTAKVFGFLVHLSCSNALVLHQYATKTKVSVLLYKKALIRDLRLVSLYDRMPPTVKVEGGIIKFIGPLPRSIAHQFKSGHFSRSTKGKRRCPMHGSMVKCTNKICDECNVGLCGTNCFIAYHLSLEQKLDL